MKLVRSGKLPATKAGTHTRLLTEDVLAFKAARAGKQSEAFDEMRRLSEGLEHGD